MNERKAYADRHTLSHLNLSGKGNLLTQKQHGQVADLLWNDLFPEDDVEDVGWQISDMKGDDDVS